MSLLALIARFVVAGAGALPRAQRPDRGRRARAAARGRARLRRADRARPGRPGRARRAAAVGAAAVRRAGPADRQGPRRASSTPADTTGGTFTVNNYGVFGVDGSAAIINHPEVAILGIGRIIDRPWVVDGTAGRPQGHPADAGVRPPGVRRRHRRRLPALRRRLRRVTDLAAGRPLGPQLQRERDQRHAACDQSEADVMGRRPEPVHQAAHAQHATPTLSTGALDKVSRQRRLGTGRGHVVHAVALAEHRPERDRLRLLAGQGERAPIDGQPRTRPGRRDGRGRARGRRRPRHARRRTAVAARSPARRRGRGRLHSRRRRSPRRRRRPAGCAAARTRRRQRRNRRPSARPTRKKPEDQRQRRPGVVAGCHGTTR